ncbi:hypothetical protein X975_01685, partial [Stegodyphus mimosarum]
MLISPYHFHSVLYANSQILNPIQRKLWHSLADLKQNLF